MRENAANRGSEIIAGYVGTAFAPAAASDFDNTTVSAGNFIGPTLHCHSTWLFWHHLATIISASPDACPPPSVGQSAVAHAGVQAGCSLLSEAIFGKSVFFGSARTPASRTGRPRTDDLPPVPNAFAAKFVGTMRLPGTRASNWLLISDHQIVSSFARRVIRRRIDSRYGHPADPSA